MLKAVNRKIFYSCLREQGKIKIIFVENQNDVHYKHFVDNVGNQIADGLYSINLYLRVKEYLGSGKNAVFGYVVRNFETNVSTFFLMS